jgi:hypothetical protein
VNQIGNPAIDSDVMGQAWRLNPNLTRLGPDDDDVMEAPQTDAMLAEADLRFDETQTTENLEALALKFEENVERSKRERWDGQERWQGRENEEMRLVNILHPNAFMRKLQAAGVDARIEFSKHARLWLNEHPRLGRIGITAWVKDEVSEALSLRTVTTLQDSGSPEWSVMRFNVYNVPTNEKYRGWRTALLHLIIANVITEEEADRAFGKPILNAASEFYRQQLQLNRQRRAGLQV